MLRQIYRRVFGSVALAFFCAAVFMSIPVLWVWRGFVQPYKTRKLERAIRAANSRRHCKAQ